MGEARDAFKPARFRPETDLEDSGFVHWERTYNNYCAQLNLSDANKLNLLPNFVNAESYKLIEKCTTVESAMNALRSKFVKTPTSIVARYHVLNLRLEQGESIRDLLIRIDELIKHCNLVDITAQECEDGRHGECEEGFQSHVVQRVRSESPF